MISNTSVTSGDKHPLLMDEMSLSTSHLLCFALQIAQGMDFLAKVPVGQFDLTRSVLFSFKESTLTLHTNRYGLEILLSFDITERDHLFSVRSPRLSTAQRSSQLKWGDKNI